MRTIFYNANEDNQQERDAQARHGESVPWRTRRQTGCGEDFRAQGRSPGSVPGRIGCVEGKAGYAES